MLILLLAAFAQDHDAPAPVATSGPRAVPAGPPRTVEATGDLDATVAGLPAGSTLLLQPRTYAGPVHLDRPVRVIGDGATITGSGLGTVLFVTGDDVVISGLTVRGGGDDATRGDAGILVTGDRFRLDRVDVEDTLTGIDLRDADDGVVSGCRVEGRPGPLGQRGDGIRLWESDRNRIEGNVLDAVRDMVVWYSEHNLLAGNRVTNSRYGAHFMHAAHNRVQDNRFEGDVVGVFVMYSEDLVLSGNLVAGADGAAGMGLGFKESDDIVATGNRLFGNTTGIYLDGTPHRIGGHARFEGNTLAYDHTGLRIHGSDVGAEFRGNRFHENGTQVTVDGRVDASGTLFEGNTWSDYVGYDLDHDGLGDLAYAPRSLTGTLAERRPSITFFAHTPAAGLLELLAAAFPMFAPRPVLVDDRPVLG